MLRIQLPISYTDTETHFCNPTTHICNSQSKSKEESQIKNSWNNFRLSTHYLNNNIILNISITEKKIFMEVGHHETSNIWELLPVKILIRDGWKYNDFFYQCSSYMNYIYCRSCHLWARKANMWSESVRVVASATPPAFIWHIIWCITWSCCRQTMFNDCLQTYTIPSHSNSLCNSVIPIHCKEKSVVIDVW